MCLVAIAHRAHPEIPLVVAGNRDEFHARPTQDAHWWPDRPDVLGGRDLQAGGTWLAVARNGRYAVVTNYRDADQPSPRLKSRGHLVGDFLGGDRSPLDYVASIDGERFAGFNLLVGDGETLAYLCNRDGAARQLEPGIYAVANATLDTPWPKVRRTKAALEKLLASNRANETELLRLLDDRERARVSEVESGPLPFDKAHALTAPFVVMPDYGTRSSTVLVRDSAGDVCFTEKRFDPAGKSTGQSNFRFTVSPRPRTP